TVTAQAGDDSAAPCRAPATRVAARGCSPSTGWSAAARQVGPGRRRRSSQGGPASVLFGAGASAGTTRGLAGSPGAREDVAATALPALRGITLNSAAGSLLTRVVGALGRAGCRACRATFLCPLRGPRGRVKRASRSTTPEGARLPE